MDKNNREIFIPEEQLTVQFYGTSVVAVRLTDGRIGTVLGHMCKAIGLDRNGQMQRISSDATIAHCLLMAKFKTEKRGFQSSDILIAWAIPYWLTGIEISRVATEKRAAILRFKAEAADVLYQHFSQRRTQQTILPASPTSVETSALIVPEQSLALPKAPTRDDNEETWIEYHEAMIEYHRWKFASARRMYAIEQRQDHMEQRQDGLEERMESAEELVRLVPEMLSQLGYKTLSPEHQRSVQANVKRLNEITGMPYATIYDTLKETFRVGTYKDIPDKEYGQVMQWFQARLQ